jgi:hypothetical protein
MEAKELMTIMLVIFYKLNIKICIITKIFRISNKEVFATSNVFLQCSKNHLQAGEKFP